MKKHEKVMEMDGKSMGNVVFFGWFLASKEPFESDPGGRRLRQRLLRGAHGCRGDRGPARELQTHAGGPKTAVFVDVSSIFVDVSSIFSWFLSVFGPWERPKGSVSRCGGRRRHPTWPARSGTRRAFRRCRATTRRPRRGSSR